MYEDLFAKVEADGEQLVVLDDAATFREEQN
jgi:hypothetical protein